MTDNIREEEVVASQNHAVTQFRLGVQLASLGEAYEGAIELSLDMGTPERQETLKKHGLSETRELKPDLVLYRATDFGFIDKGKDRARVMEPPLLCAEIISPNQVSLEILDKFRVYFDIGVKSCWYVDPILKTVHVYGNNMENEVFHNTDMVDSTLGITIPLNKIFY
jgi:Uma2 family endonuclease